MRVERVELFLLKLPLKKPFETSFGIDPHRTPILCRIEGEGAVGWSECVAQELPAYSEETVQRCWRGLTDYLIALVLGKRSEQPEGVAGRFEDVRGNPMAEAKLEVAGRDPAAKQKDRA